MRFELHSGALRDWDEAADYYQEHGGDPLALAFASEIERSIELLLENPAIAPVWLHGKRRFIIRRFPYAIIYRVDGDVLRVLAVAHHARRPGFWRQRQ